MEEQIDLAGMVSTVMMVVGILALMVFAAFKWWSAYKRYLRRKEAERIEAEMRATRLRWDEARAQRRRMEAEGREREDRQGCEGAMCTDRAREVLEALKSGRRPGFMQ